MQALYKGQKYFTVLQLAERWGYTERHIRRLKSKGKSPRYLEIAHGFYKRIIFLEQDVIDFEKKFDLPPRGRS